MRKNAEEIAIATAELAVLIARVTGVREAGAAQVAFKLGKLAHGLSTLAEIDCNQGLTPNQERREQRLRGEIEELLGDLNDGLSDRITATFGGDPRGYVVKLHFPKIDGFKPSNTWGGESEGWGIG